MKILSVFLIIPLLLILLSGCQTLDPTTPPEGYVRIGLLTSVSGDNITSTLRYDENGRLLGIRKMAGEKIIYGRSYAYDEDGNVVAMVDHASGHQYTYDLHGNILTDEIENTRWVNTYDEHSNILTKQYYSPLDRLRSEVRHTYDSDGNLVCMDNLDGEGHITSQTIYTYDHFGNCTSEKIYVDGKLSDIHASFEWDYDENGYPKEERLYYGTELGFTRYYTYDARGNKLNSKEGSESDNREYICTYDEQNNLLSEQYIDRYNGKVDTQTHTYVYDDQNRMIEHRMYDDQDGHSYVYLYIYDERGNLLEESKTGNYFKPSKQTYTYDEYNNCIERTIEYASEIVKTVWNYNQWGKISSSTGTTYNRSGEEKSSSMQICHYDAYGNITAHIRINSQGDNTTTYTYQYINVPADLAQKYAEEQEEILYIVENASDISTMYY